MNLDMGINGFVHTLPNDRFSYNTWNGTHIGSSNKDRRHDSSVHLYVRTEKVTVVVAT
jgi:pantothenate kinase